jgi:hypothetical protein
VIRGEERGWHQREAASRKLGVALEVADIWSPDDLDGFLHDGRQTGRSHLDVVRPSTYLLKNRLPNRRSSIVCLRSLTVLTIDVKTATALGRFWCIKGAQSKESQQFDVRIDHGVSAWSQIVRNEVPTRGRPRPNENWCLWILCASSIPTIVTAALANDLKPRMGPHLCLIAR